MMFSLPALLLATLMLSSGVLGQVPAGLEGFPVCATGCITEAFEQGLCAATDQTCICTDATFQAQVTECVTASCTIPEALVTHNQTLASCGAPVRDRSHQLLVVSISMACVADLFVLLRVIYKAFIMHMDFGLDDWFVLATVLAGLPSVVITAEGLVPNGLGRDIWTLTATEITNVVRYFYLMAWLYFLQTALLKLTIICFYMRIFPSQGVRRLLWGTFIFVSLWGVAFVLAAIFQCRPISYFWHRWDGMHEGTCIEINALSWSNAAMNIAIDCWILAIPIWQLRKLHLHWKKKIPVGIMFSLGFFVTIVSILRLRSLVNFGTHENVTWEFYDVALWSTIEVCVGIITACLPTVRIFLVKIFPMLSGSSYASKGAYYNHSSNPRSGNMNPARNEVRIASKGRPESVSDGGSPPGIQFQKSYAVQYSDNDESSLVRGSDIELSSPPKAWQRTPPTS